MSYQLTWGAGETEQGTENFPNMAALRSMLENDTEMSKSEIDTFLLALTIFGRAESGGDDPTQFDDPWIKGVQQ